MKNYFDLSGRVAVVTGCSTGLGVQMAKALANQGCSIVAVARRQNLIDEVATQIKEEYGVETLAVRCDITDTDMVNAMVDTVLEKFGRIDVLINNAGTGAVAPAEDITDDQFANEMNIDLFGSFKVARAVAKKAMIPAKYGRIINISSASVRGTVGQCNYAATKAAMIGFTNTLAKESAKKGITVNCVAPGATDTDMYQAVPQHVMDAMIASNPMNRLGKPSEIGEVIAFVASERASYLNGQWILVNGGK